MFPAGQNKPCGIRSSRNDSELEASHGVAMKQRLLFLTLLLLIVIGMGIAGTTGKIAGVVKDDKTGEELIGANVVIEGTTRGAATNVDGYFVILNVPPGKYTFVASAVGYNRKTVTNVNVSIDLTTTINFNLSSEVVQQEEVVVVAERPVIQKDLTAKTAVIGSDQIAALPVTEVSQLLSLQAGFVAGSLRGGRSGEVAYWIDGVPVTDVYDGSQVVEVNKNLIQELQLVSGAFNAEYGQAMSGIVNIATKEGSSKFTGSVGSYVGDYVSSHTDIFPGIDKVSPTAIRNFEANISGPLVGDDLTFFANGRYIYFDGWLSGYRRFNPSNVAVKDSNRISRDPSRGLGDSARVPLNDSERKYAQAKLAWRASGTLKATVNFIYDNRRSRPDFDRDRYRGYFYNPDGVGNNHDVSNTLLFQLSHIVGERTFYTVGGSYLDKNSKYYLYEDLHDPRYVHREVFNTRFDSYSFGTGGTDNRRFERSTRTLLGKADISSQIDEANLIKAGVEFRKHKLFYENYDLIPIQSQSAFNPITSNPFITTQVPPFSSPSYETYTHRPTEFSAYIQDKMEFKNFILNIGVRFDYFQPDGVVLADESDPNIYDPIKEENKAKTLDERRTYWYKKATAKSQFSPRIGASFPITERGVVHFSYGHFFQVPRFERLYQRPDFKVLNNGGDQGTIGNADLKPEQTINGEIGIQQQITDDVAVDLTAYIRDIRNLTTTGTERINTFGGGSLYSKYQNKDFGFVKGIVLTVDKRFAGGLAATLDYTYQVAKGSGSNPDDAAKALRGGTLPEVQLTPLEWDQRHTLNITASYNAEGWGVSMISQYGSGKPYTPRRVTDISTLATNSQLKPTFFNVDVRAFYEIPLNPIRVVAFVRVFNLFDAKSERDVFDDTGRAGFTTDYEKALRENTEHRVNSVSDWFRIPTNFSEPRRVELGINLEF